VKAETRSDYQAAVLGAVERVIAALDEALDLEGLARGAALSTFHFHRVFRGVVGETPLELHRRLRLERAVESLCRTSRTVTEIAFDAGYETHEDFTRSFRHQYGVAPSAFRRRSRAALAGDVEALGRMLADDAVFHQDGGGKRRAALKPICGKDKIVRFFEGGLRHRAAKRAMGGSTRSSARRSTACPAS
jgi:AraC family transcriptional regulator